MPHPERRLDYIRVVGPEHDIICTRDHIVDGKPAGEHETIFPERFVESGDLKLDGSNTYIANGFTVTSMFDVYEV